MERAQVLSPEQQLAAIKQIYSYTDYEQFVSRLFKKHVDDTPSPQRYLQKIQDALQTNDRYYSPDYWRWLAMVDHLFAQFGYPSLSGKFERHRSKGWIKPVMDPRHHLALACYAGSLNCQAYPIKKEWIVQYVRLNSFNDNKQLGIWGSPLVASQGMVHSSFHPGIMAIRSERRMNMPRPICLTNLELNHQFQAIGFTGEDAEQMSDEQFSKQVYPHVVQVIGQYMDPIAVFTPQRK